MREAALLQDIQTGENEAPTLATVGDRRSQSNQSHCDQPSAIVSASPILPYPLSYPPLPSYRTPPLMSPLLYPATSSCLFVRACPPIPHPEYTSQRQQKAKAGKTVGVVVILDSSGDEVESQPVGLVSLARLFVHLEKRKVAHTNRVIR